MKKRQHTHQVNFSYKINGGRSVRSLRTSSRSASREMSGKLASSAKSAHNVSSDEVTLLNEWEKEEELELKLADEISEKELKQFSFHCIEVLATLSEDQKPYMVDALVGLVEAKLPAYLQLQADSQQANLEFKSQSLNSKLVGDAKKLESVLEVMCYKHRSENLAKRVNFLQQAVPNYFVNVGNQIGLPKALLQNVSKVLTKAMSKCALK